MSLRGKVTFRGGVGSWITTWDGSSQQGAPCLAWPAGPWSGRLFTSESCLIILEGKKWFWWWIFWFEFQMSSFKGIHLKSLRFQLECVEVLKIQLAGHRHGIFHRLNFDDINKISFFDISTVSTRPIRAESAADLKAVHPVFNQRELNLFCINQSVRDMVSFRPMAQQLWKFCSQ